MGISKISRLTKEELIELVRTKEFEMNKLKKELDTANRRWRNFYRQKQYREE